MSFGKDDSLQSISVQLNGTNYSYWSYIMKKNLRGKSLWSYVCDKDTTTKPADAKTTESKTAMEVWEVNNSKIITWINNSVTHSIGAQLAKYETAKEVWDHLSRLYTQSNFAKQYQLEMDIRALQQHNMSVQEFYSAMSSLWDQLALTEPAELTAVAAYIKRREEQRLVQFLMALRFDFEPLRGSILHRTPLPSVDSVVNELLAEEIRLKSNGAKENSLSGTPSVFAVPPRSYGGIQNRPVRALQDECSFCRDKGHWKSSCPQLLSLQQRPPQQQRQQQRPLTPRSSQQYQQRPWTPRPPRQPQFPSGPATWTPRPPPATNSVAVPSLDPDMYEKFQQFIDSQQHAMSVSPSLGLSSSTSSGISSSI